MELRLPTDRINNFSDAIYAIAITLLVLEVKVPPTEDIQTYGTWGTLSKLTPSFIGLLISFFVTALYWRAHLIHASLISFYNNRLLWTNLFLLLFVVLLPFSTGLYSKFFNYNHAFVVYCLNLFLIGLFNYLMIVTIIRKEKNDDPRFTPVFCSWLKFRASVAPIVWMVSALIVYAFPVVARFLFISIFLILAIGERRFKPRLQSAKAEEGDAAA